MDGVGVSQNHNKSFADSINKNAIRCEKPEPEIGQIWKHRNGHHYEILLTHIEAAGHLRKLYPSGYLHLYHCIGTGKPFVRLTDLWEDESQSFEPVTRPIKFIQQSPDEIVSILEKDVKSLEDIIAKTHWIPELDRLRGKREGVILAIQKIKESRIEAEKNHGN